MEYKIGDFSKITKISRRMLRYLDNEALLKPCKVEENGYRYYSSSEVEKAAKIMHLKRFHFTYSEIKTILENQLEDDPLIYRERLESIKLVVKDYDKLILELEEQHLEESQCVNPYDIQVSHKKGFFALKKSGTYNPTQMELFLEDTFNELNRHDISRLGSYFVAMDFNSNDEDEDQECEMLKGHYFQPIMKHMVVKGFETVEFKSVQWISTLHYGDYDSIYKAYEQLYAYATAHNLSIGEVFYEKYFVDAYYTSHHNEYITEISTIVSKND